MFHMDYAEVDKMADRMHQNQNFLKTRISHPALFIAKSGEQLLEVDFMFSTKVASRFHMNFGWRRIDDLCKGLFQIFLSPRTRKSKKGAGGGGVWFMVKNCIICHPWKCHISY